MIINVRIFANTNNMKNYNSDLISECGNANVKQGRKQRLSCNLTKQKYCENENCYVVFNCNNVLNQTQSAEENFILQLSKTIKVFLGNSKKILVVGLGNRYISADGLGTETLKRVVATRSLVVAKREVSVISTSVFGLTGIESADIIKSVSNIVKPDTIILIDTLCANSYENLITNFQISNAGFSPGAGVGNYRKIVNKKTLNVNVVSIGVPMVVYAKSFVESAINSVMQTTMHNTKKHDNIAIFNKLLKQNFNNLVLTVKDVDVCVKKLAYIIGSAINMACNNYTLEEQKIIFGE